MWRLLYSKHKLSKGVLQVALVDIFMWCSIIITRAKNCVASLAMFTSDVRCYEHIEKLRRYLYSDTNVFVVSQCVQRTSDVNLSPSLPLNSSSCSNY